MVNKAFQQQFVESRARKSGHIGDRFMAGVDIRTVAELLGHKTLAMTMRYAHLAPDHQLAAVEKLEATATKTATSAEPVLGYTQ
jgi:integrase